MIQILGTPLLHLIILTVFVYLGYLNYGIEDIKKLSLFYVLYFVFFGLLAIPLAYDIDIIFADSRWNWTGKALTIVMVVIVLTIFKWRKEFFIPQRAGIKTKPIILIVLFFMLTSAWQFFTPGSLQVNYDTLFFSLIMSSISEELFFRGIMLGLFCHWIYPDKEAVFYNLFLTSLLFGIGHGLIIDEQWQLQLDISSILNTFFLGLFWAWLSYYSKSVVYSMISHSSINVMHAFIPL